MRASKRRLLALGMTCACVLVFDIVPLQTASAYAFLNCRWGGTFNANSAINYRYSDVTSGYRTAFEQGQYAWDTKAVPGYFNPTTATTQQLLIIDNSYADGWYAYTSYTCTSGTFSSSQTVKFNERTMAVLPAYSKALVTMHELGHTYGLTHVSNTCSDTRIGPSVMVGDSTTGSPCGGSPPYADDINGVNAIY